MFNFNDTKVPSNIPISPDQAIQCKDSDKVEEHCEWLSNNPVEGKEILTHRDEKGWTCVHYAAQYYCNDILDATVEVDKGLSAPEGVDGITAGVCLLVCM